MKRVFITQRVEWIEPIRERDITWIKEALAL